MYESNSTPNYGRASPSDVIEGLLQKGKDDSDTMVEVSISIWFTTEFAAMEEDVQGYINTCFEEANAALANSLVPMRLKHHGTRLYEKEEIYDGEDMLYAFADSGSKDVILNSADASYLLTSKSNVCGIAYFDTVAVPFAMATHSCARYGGDYIPLYYLYPHVIQFQGWLHISSRVGSYFCCQPQ